MSSECAKCGSAQLVDCYSWKDRFFGAGNFIRIGPFSFASTNRRVCLDCGYCEEWVSASGLEKLRKKFGLGRGSSALERLAMEVEDKKTKS